MAEQVESTNVVRYNLARDDDFNKRVESSMMKSARDAAAEPVETANHANRKQFSMEVARNPRYYAPLFALAIANTAGINASNIAGTPDKPVFIGTDSDLDFLSNSVFEIFVPAAPKAP